MPFTANQYAWDLCSKYLKESGITLKRNEILSLIMEQNIVDIHSFHEQMKDRVPSYGLDLEPLSDAVLHLPHGDRIFELMPSLFPQNFIYDYSLN